MTIALPFPNATTDETRDEVMPINKKWNIGKLLAAIRAYPLERRRRVTFEYVLLAGVNDAPEDAARLSRLLRGLPCKVSGGACPYLDSNGLPVSYVTFIQNTRGGQWEAITVNPASRIREWAYNGSTWSPLN